MENNITKRIRRRRPWKDHKNVNPLVLFLFKQMREKGLTMQEVAQRAGFTSIMLYKWGAKADAKVFSLQCVGEVLGYELCWKNKKTNRTLSNIESKLKRENARLRKLVVGAWRLKL